MRKISIFVGVVVVVVDDDGYNVVLNRESGQKTALYRLPRHESVLPAYCANQLSVSSHDSVLRCFANPEVDSQHETVYKSAIASWHVISCNAIAHHEGVLQIQKWIHRTQPYPRPARNRIHKPATPSRHVIIHVTIA